MLGLVALLFLVESQEHCCQIATRHICEIVLDFLKLCNHARDWERHESKWALDIAKIDGLVDGFLTLILAFKRNPTKAPFYLSEPIFMEVLFELLTLRPELIDGHVNTQDCDCYSKP